MPRDARIEAILLAATARERAINRSPQQGVSAALRLALAASKKRRPPSKISLATSVVVVALLLIAAPWRQADNVAQAAPPSPVLPDMVTRETVKSIERGLEYLKRTQRNDGSWIDGGGYGGGYPAVMSSLAGLALLSSGSTPESGPYSKQVKKAMLYVLRLGESDKDGLISGPGGEGRSMYGHGFGMLFLAQCYGMDVNREFSERIRKLLDRAILVTASAQSKKTGPSPGGGWIYTPSGGGDEGSVTVTQLQALRACRNVGVKVPKDVIEKAVAYLKFCQEPDGGICYSAQSRGSSRPPISAAAIACFYAAGVYDRQAGGAGPEAEMVEKLITYLKRNAMDLNRSEGHWFYMHFYLSQGLYMRGGTDWQGYYPKIRDRLVQSQVPDGSWNGDGVGTTYGTAIATTILQLPFGMLPISQR